MLHVGQGMGSCTDLGNSNSGAFCLPCHLPPLVEPASVHLSKMRTTAFVSSPTPPSLALCVDESSDSCDSRGASRTGFTSKVSWECRSETAGFSKWLVRFALLHLSSFQDP